MKKIIFLSIISVLCGVANAQVNKAKSPAPKNNAHLKVFYQSISSGDITTGISALNYYISEQGANSAYEDTLAMLYMQQGSFVQCYY